jgi:hypothetical protein
VGGQFPPQFPLEVVGGAAQSDGEGLGDQIDLRMFPAPVVDYLVSLIPLRRLFHGNKGNSLNVKRL